MMGAVTAPVARSRLHPRTVLARRPGRQCGLGSLLSGAARGVARVVVRVSRPDRSSIAPDRGRPRSDRAPVPTRATGRARAGRGAALAARVRAWATAAGRRRHARATGTHTVVDSLRAAARRPRRPAGVAVRLAGARHGARAAGSACSCAAATVAAARRRRRERWRCRAPTAPRRASGSTWSSAPQRRDVAGRHGRPRRAATSRPVIGMLGVLTRRGRVPRPARRGGAATCGARRAGRWAVPG